MLEHVTREITVEALPTEIPERITVDVSEMEINDTINLASVAVPARRQVHGRRPRGDHDRHPEPAAGRGGARARARGGGRAGRRGRGGPRGRGGRRGRGGSRGRGAAEGEGGGDDSGGSSSGPARSPLRSARSARIGDRFTRDDPYQPVQPPPYRPRAAARANRTIRRGRGARRPARSSPGQQDQGPGAQAPSHRTPASTTCSRGGDSRRR